MSGNRFLGTGKGCRRKHVYENEKYEKAGNGKL